MFTGTLTAPFKLAIHNSPEENPGEIVALRNRHWLFPWHKALLCWAEEPCPAQSSWSGPWGAVGCLGAHAPRAMTRSRRRGTNKTHQHRGHHVPAEIPLRSSQLPGWARKLQSPGTGRCSLTPAQTYALSITAGPDIRIWLSTSFTSLWSWNLVQTCCQNLNSTQFYNDFTFSLHLQKKIIQIWDQNENQMCRLQHPVIPQGHLVWAERCLTSRGWLCRDRSSPPTGNISSNGRICTCGQIRGVFWTCSGASRNWVGGGIKS